MKNLKNNKVFGLLVLLLIYIIAVAVGLLVFYFLKDHIHFLLAILISDVTATIFVWVSGLIVKTPSVYDPYWSVQTVLIYLPLLFYFNNWNMFTIIPLVVMLLYSIRLTVNFIKGFHGLAYVDWRYDMLKQKSGKLFQLVNLMGICMFPTLVVYSASIPLFIYASLSIDSYSYLDLIGSFVILVGIYFELIADLQMKAFIKIRKSKSDVIDIGMWKYSRHPNYLGEIMIWFGVAFILIIHNYQMAYWIIGAIINLLMFLFISIPMEEKHMLEYKPELKEYIKTTSCLLLLPKKRVKE